MGKGLSKPTKRMWGLAKLYYSQSNNKYDAAAYWLKKPKGKNK